MTNALRVTYRIWLLILVVAVIVQIGAAGFGAFNAAHHIGDTKPLTNHEWDHGWSFHDFWGYLILVVSIPLFLLAWGAKLGRRTVLLALGVPILVLIQILLAVGGESVPAVGVLHPINAFIILGFVGSLAARAWGTRGSAAQAPEAAQT
jgi:heme A synthase